MNKDVLTKIAGVLISALIIALQSVNLGQGAAISHTEARIEKIEDDLSKANYELNKMIVANQETFRQKTDIYENKLTEIANASYDLAKTIEANQEEFKKAVVDLKKGLDDIKKGLPKQ